ncbi:MAG: DALR anticodon-binding domain-containing protein [Acutalibacteraceae bacterium]
MPRRGRRGRLCPCAGRNGADQNAAALPSACDAALCEYEPSIISRYVLDVCAAYNVFYHNCPILRSSGAEQAFRLRLTAAARQIIGKSLDLLTIRRTEEI